MTFPGSMKRQSTMARNMSSRLKLLRISGSDSTQMETALPKRPNAAKKELHGRGNNDSTRVQIIRAVLVREVQKKVRKKYSKPQNSPQKSTLQKVGTQKSADFD
jgi:hypothetical protein